MLFQGTSSNFIVSNKFSRVLYLRIIERALIYCTGICPGEVHFHVVTDAFTVYYTLINLQTIYFPKIEE